MLTDVAGVLVGHWTDAEAQTGCTAVVLPEGTVASGEVRGGAPATREFALLEPTKLVQHIDAVCLSGGSAFGLAAGDGVMAVLAEQGRGFPTAGGHVPIVVGMSLYDLAVGDAGVRPTSEHGALAAAAAATGPHAVGLVGAGTGATVGKYDGRPWAPGGLGTATMRFDTDGREVVVSALIAANAYGSIDDGTSLDDPGPRPPGSLESSSPREHTTIGVVVTNAAVDKVGCQLLSQSAHDGLARGLLPAHTIYDGDAIVAAATGEVNEVDLVRLRVVAQHVVTRAVRSLAATSSVAAAG